MEVTYMKKTAYTLAFLLFGLLSANIVAAQPAYRPNYIWGLAWNPDGSTIAMGAGPEICNVTDGDYSIRILDAQDGSLIDSVAGGHCPTDWVQWSPDGSKLLTSSSAEGYGFVWDVTAKRVLGISPDFSGGGDVSNVWSPDGTAIAGGSDVGRFITIWNPITGTEISTTQTQELPLSLAWGNVGSDGISKLASGTLDITIWNSANTRTKLRTLTGHTGSVSSLDWSPDGNKLASGGADFGVGASALIDHSVRVWDVYTGNMLWMSENHTDIVSQVVWSPDGKMIASASSDDSVRIWDAVDGTELKALHYDGPVYALDWSPDSSQLVYGGVGIVGQDAQVQIISLSEMDIATPAP
jgi:WD40 repeat protein